MRMLTRIVAGGGLSFVRLCSVLVAWGLWYRNPSAGWALTIALLPLALSPLAGQMPLRRTPLDVPLTIFYVTAGLGVWAAYDRAGAQVIFSEFTPVGWQALWGLGLAALLFHALTTLETETEHRWSLALLSSIGAVTAVWFAAANDWTASPAKLAAITRIGETIQAWLPTLPGRWLNSNIPGGIMAILLPPSLALVSEAHGSGRERRWLWVAWGMVTGATMGLGLILTTSRGAWMGIATSLALEPIWWLAERLSSGRRRLVAFLGLIGSGLLAGIVLAEMVPSLRMMLQRSLAINDRFGIFSEALLLVRDYPFTGFGLGEFALIHSTYALLIHVPILAYAHSLFLDIALGQGVFGILATAGVLGGAAWLGLDSLTRVNEPPPILVAGLLSLTTMMVHGLVDDPLYISRAMPLLWVPAGLIVAGWRKVIAEPAPTRRSRPRGWPVLGVATLVGLTLLSFLWPPLRAVWHANLGALRQTQVELSRYDYEHFDDPTLDEIRQEADLSAAERHFTQAIALDPGQVTARTRLAGIALSRGQYDEALAHAQAAWDGGHRDRVTRLLLGDALVATGLVDEGVQVVRGLAWVEGRLDGQAYYRYWLGEDYDRAADAWRATVTLNPRNDRARHWITEAETRAENR